MAGYSTARIENRSRIDTRTRLINIGTEILSEKGFGTTGIEQILTLAGVPKGSFYYYFESKAKFGLAVIDNYERLWAQKLTRLLRDSSVPPLERIGNYISEGARGLEKYAFRRGCLIGNMGQEMASLDEDFRTRILNVFESWSDYIVECLSEAKSAGDLPDDFNVEDTARVFWFAWEGAVLQAKLERSVAPIEQFRHVLFGMVLTRGAK